MSATEFARAHAAAATISKKVAEVGNRPPTPPPTNATVATIVPFPVQAQGPMIEKELRSVTGYDDVARYKWLTGVTRRHRTRLRNLGVAPELIEADTRALQEAFGLVESYEGNI